MSEDRNLEAGSKRASGPLASWPILLAALVIATAIVLQPRMGSSGLVLEKRIDTLQAVTLANGQVYFGTLSDVKNGAIVLTGVFETVTTVNQKTGQRISQLSKRQTAYWHGPTDMIIPIDRLLFSETIGKTSPVARAIKQAESKK